MYGKFPDNSEIDFFRCKIKGGSTKRKLIDQNEEINIDKEKPLIDMKTLVRNRNKWIQEVYELGTFQRLKKQ